MSNVQEFIDSQLARGRTTFSKRADLAATGLTPQAFQAAASRLAKKGLLASPRRGFYLILRPEDRLLGAPDPARWIDALMKYLGLDYRVSLLRAAAFHGSSHQAAMVFQVIAPRQLPAIALGRQRVEFLYQAPAAFAEANRPESLASLKTETGYAKIAGVELTLLGGHPIPRAIAEERMLQKLNQSLTEDIAPLLPAGVQFSDDDAIAAFGRVWQELIARIPGDSWKSSPKAIEAIRAAKYPALL
jgi:hypothetical protein